MPIGSFVEKEYQQRALERFDAYLAALEEPRKGYEAVLKIKLEQPDLPIPLPHFPAQAWDELCKARSLGRPNKEYSPRETGDGKPVPNCTFKLPTGGGKTYLAAAAVARLVTKYLRADETRFVLWVVPSEAIYAQTKAVLSDREHPYRQLLDRASGGRVRILDKESPLHADDLKGYLSVMLLMLPSANRETQETLRMFRDRGNVNGFLPPEDDRPAHEALWKHVPNLDYIAQGAFGDQSVGLVKPSLGNALRLIRPIVVMDEGQKAFGSLAHKTLYGFNPAFVIELSATPRDSAERWSNWLTDIRGTDLEREEMIKMPLILHAEESTDWRDCLRKAWERTKELQSQADRLRDDTNTYIRPILLVQVENTGPQTLNTAGVHAYQARDHLMTLGLEAEAVRLKTATENEIEGEDLMADDCPVRAIITKTALQEGWDCPFAYVLCSLIPSSSANAMTQMVGRVLRQPYVSRTGVEALDRCYVFTNFAQTAKVLEAIKKGLEGEGMGDLAARVQSDKGEKSSADLVRQRREPFKAVEYYLPRVMVSEQDRLREIDWESDILGAIDWSTIDVSEHAHGLPKSLDTAWGTTLVIGMDYLRTRQGHAIEEGALAPEKYDLTYGVRVLCRDVPNPFVAARIIGGYLDVLRSQKWQEKELGLQQRYITDEIVRHTRAAVESACRKVFEASLQEHRIRFNLRTTFGAWAVPDDSPVAATGLQGREDGQAFQKSLFDPVQKHELNNYELKVASYIDRDGAIDWWYRNVVQGGYGLQGWRKNVMYPDFIIARRRDGTHEWVVLETKGSHLEMNTDTAYKRDLAAKLESAFEAQRDLPAVGELEVWEANEHFGCKIVMEEGWESEVASILQS